MNRGYPFEIETVDDLRAFLKELIPDCPDNIIEKSVYRIEGSGSSKLATKTGTESVLEGDVIFNFRYVEYNVPVQSFVKTKFPCLAER